MNSIVKEIAGALDYSQYTGELSLEIRQKAQQNRIVIIFGYSDDLMELRGAVDDETSDIAYFNDNGLLVNDCEDSKCPYFKEIKQTAKSVSAIWDECAEFVWTYKTTIPHETFRMYEYANPWCKGIVFCLDDI